MNTRFRKPTRDYRYNMSQVEIQGKLVHVIIEKTGRSWRMRIVEWKLDSWHGSEKAARLELEELKAGSVELLLR